MRTLDNIIADIQNEASRRIETAKKDYEIGKRDCKCGIYDKWYRYNHSDEGAAYGAGWMEQNKTTKNTAVQFLAGE